MLRLTLSAIYIINVYKKNVCLTVGFINDSGFDSVDLWPWPLCTHHKSHMDTMWSFLHAPSLCDTLVLYLIQNHVHIDHTLVSYNVLSCEPVNTKWKIKWILLHSQCMTKIQVGHGDKSWSNLSRLRFDQDFTSWPRIDQHFTKDGLDIDQDMTNRLVKSYLKST